MFCRCRGCNARQRDGGDTCRKEGALLEGSGMGRCSPGTWVRVRLLNTQAIFLLLSGTWATIASSAACKPSEELAILLPFFANTGAECSKSLRGHCRLTEASWYRASQCCAFFTSATQPYPSSSILARANMLSTSPPWKRSYTCSWPPSGSLGFRPAQHSL